MEEQWKINLQVVGKFLKDSSSSIDWKIVKFDVKQCGLIHPLIFTSSATSSNGHAVRTVEQDSVKSMHRYGALDRWYEGINGNVYTEEISMKRSTITGTVYVRALL